MVHLVQDVCTANMQRSTARMPALRVPGTTGPTQRAPRGVCVSDGSMATAGWLRGLELSAPDERWHVDITLSTTDAVPPRTWSVADTRFKLYLFGTEWSFQFCHAGRSSWLRFAEQAFVHGRDDFELLAQTPRLDALGVLLAHIEAQHDLRFQRDRARVHTALPHATDTIAAWVARL